MRLPNYPQGSEPVQLPIREMLLDLKSDRGFVHARRDGATRHGTGWLCIYSNRCELPGPVKTEKDGERPGFCNSYESGFTP
jgi:hypothetical protein